jgi:hypothetical protein
LVLLPSCDLNWNPGGNNAQGFLFVVLVYLQKGEMCDILVSSCSHN